MIKETPAQIINKVNISVPYVQAIYDLFKEIGVTLPIEDIPSLIWHVKGKGGNPINFTTYVEDKLLALPAYANVVALGLNRNQTLGMLNLPNYAPIRSYLINTNLRDHIPAHILYMQYLQVTGDVVEIIPGSLDNLA